MDKKIRFFGSGIAVFVMLALALAQAQSVSTNAPTNSGLVQSNASQYSQYYQIASGSAPSNKISAPEEYDISDHTPNTVYLTTQNQAVPYSRYQTNTKNAVNSLWIQGTSNWAQYAVVPQGSVVSLLAVSPVEGIGNLNFMDYDGQMYNYNFYFYPESHMTFYADKAGRHVISFATGNKSSNAIIIDVTGTYTAPSNYLPTPATSYSTYSNPYNNPPSELALQELERANQMQYNYGTNDWEYYANLYLNSPYR